MRRWLVAVALLAGGCFNPNLDGKVACGANNLCPPGYTCNQVDTRCYKTPPAGSVDMSGGGGGGGGGGGDGGDMGSGGGGDMAGSSSCGTDGTRVCINNNAASAVCTGGAPMLDRTCPPGSTCMTGHCQPPTGATSCMSGKDCTTGGTVCDFYNVGGALLGYCTMPIAGSTGAAGATCAAAGFDGTCKTGICAADAANAGNRACLFQCKTQGDCGGGGLVCTAFVGAPGSIESANTGGLKFCTH